MQLASVTAPAPTPAPIAAAPPQQPVPVPAAVPVPATAAPQAVQDASLSQRLLGKIGMSQQRSLENQQLLGAVTGMVGERISQTFANVLRLLRGEVDTQPAG